MTAHAATTTALAPLRGRILDFIWDFAKPEDRVRCTLDEVEGEFGSEGFTEALAMIHSRKIFVCAPLALLEGDTAIGVIFWKEGRTTAAEIEQFFGKPHDANVTGGRKVLTYNLYTTAEDPDHPPIPAPYAVRDAEDPCRPDECHVPFAPLWTPEVLQIDFVFDADGVLASYDFKVVEQVSLRAAILHHIADCRGTAMVFELEKLQEKHGGDLREALLDLINAGSLYVREPLKRLDFDTTVMRVDWIIGRSTYKQLRGRALGPHSVTKTDAGRVLTYDLYWEIVDAGYPLPPAPYAEREAANHDRPEGCSFPFTGIWPPEALQVEFTFDAAGVLKSYQFMVGQQVP